MGRISTECAAGFFDGEGWAGVEHRPQRNGPGGWWRLRACVGQNDRRPLDALKARWGGAIHRRVTKHGIHYQWVVTTTQAQQFLEDVRPFLIVKAEVVDIVLEIRSGNAIVGRKGLPSDELERRLALKERLRVVNARHGRPEREVG